MYTHTHTSLVKPNGSLVLRTSTYKVTLSPAILNGAPHLDVLVLVHTVCSYMLEEMPRVRDVMNYSTVGSNHSHAGCKDAPCSSLSASGSDWASSIM